MDVTKNEATEAYIARQFGAACSHCGVSNGDCLRRVLIRHGAACCGPCGSIDTHRSDELAAAANQAVISGAVSSSRAEAADRVLAFLDARAGMSNVDPDEVMTIFRNDVRYSLLVEDLRVLAADLA